MSSQFIALVEETLRGTTPAGPYLFLPIIGDLTPEFDAADKPRSEFRGQENAFGAITVVRTEVKWSIKLKCYWYPGKETALLFKHLLGNPAARTVIDTSAYKGLITPAVMPYGSGMPLGDSAISIVANTDEQGVTRSQTFGGGRVTDCKISCKGADDIELEFTLEGAWVGPADQATLTGVSFPAANPFNSSQYRAYIGGAPVRTGTAPLYSNIAPGTAVQFAPDSLDITITNGLKDKIVGNGVRGPSKTRRDAAFKVEVSCPIDYEDPSSGFSSANEFKRLFSGPATSNLFVTFDNGDLAGAATQHYAAAIDLPLMMQKNAKKADRSVDGKTPSLKLGYESLVSPITGYPMALQLADLAATI
jgi:hypothetical protein